MWSLWSTTVRAGIELGGSLECSRTLGYVAHLQMCVRLQFAEFAVQRATAAEDPNMRIEDQVRNSHQVQGLECRETGKVSVDEPVVVRMQTPRLVLGGLRV